MYGRGSIDSPIVTTPRHAPSLFAPPTRTAKVEYATPLQFSVEMIVHCRCQRFDGSSRVKFVWILVMSGSEGIHHCCDSFGLTE